MAKNKRNCQDNTADKLSKAQLEHFWELEQKDLLAGNAPHFKLENGSIKLVDARPYYKDGKIIIPEPFDYIGSNAFIRINAPIKTLVLPKTLEKFKSFRGRIGVYELVLPEGIKSFRLDILNGFYELYKVVLPKSLEHIYTENWTPRRFCTFCVPKGSYAEAFVKDSGLTYEITEQTQR